jgi:hypothetical protein
MKNFEQNLTESSAKFIHVGSNTYINTQGQTEVCRKGQRGEYCKRHHVTSFINSSFYRNQLSKIEARTAEKLSPFENAMSWLYSVLMKTTLDEARSRYIEGTAMYSMLDMQAPDEHDVKGLQKALLKLIDTSRVEKTKMDKLKELVKNMALGKGFTIAGYYALKDMTRETLRKFKIGAAGAALAGTMVLTGCSTPESNNITPGISSLPSESTEPGSSNNDSSGIYNTSDGRTPAEGDIDQSISILTVPKTMFKEYVYNRIADEYGEYAVTKISYPSIDSVTNRGVSAKIVPSALEFYTNFVSTEVLDSIALDNYNNYDKWVKEVAPKYVAPEFLDILMSYQNSERPTALIFNNYDPNNINYPKNLIPVLIRDGGPRIFNKNMWGIFVEPVKGAAKTIYVKGMGSATIVADDEASIAWENIVAPGMKWDNFPVYTDGKPQASQIIYEVGLTLREEGESWLIVGYSNSFRHAPSDFYEPTPQKIFDWRKQIR